MNSIDIMNILTPLVKEYSGEKELNDELVKKISDVYIKYMEDYKEKKEPLKVLTDAPHEIYQLNIRVEDIPVNYYLFKCIDYTSAHPYRMKGGFEFQISNPYEFVLEEGYCYLGKLKFINKLNYPTVECLDLRNVGN